MADLCLWPLSCWNIHPVGIFFLGKGSMCFSNISLYILVSMRPSICTRGSTADALKHPHTVADPPPCLTVGIWYFGSNLVPTGRRIHRFSPFPNILKLDLSLQRILDHCARDQSLCDFAQFFRSVNYFLGINGLQTPTLPFKPSLPKRRFIVVTEILSSRIGEISVRIWGAVRRELEREVLIIILSTSLLVLWGPPVLGRFCRDRWCCVSSNQWESDCLETCKIATTSAKPCPALTCLTILSFNSTV